MAGGVSNPGASLSAPRTVPPASTHTPQVHLRPMPRNRCSGTVAQTAEGTRYSHTGSSSHPGHSWSSAGQCDPLGASRIQLKSLSKTAICTVQSLPINDNTDLHYRCSARCCITCMCSAYSAAAAVSLSLLQTHLLVPMNYPLAVHLDYFSSLWLLLHNICYERRNIMFPLGHRCMDLCNRL
jgi:hypothetical protein